MSNVIKFPVQSQTVHMQTGDVTETRTVYADLTPAPEGTCRDCGVQHDPEMPHDACSLRYQYCFWGRHGRWPSWQDAIAHCEPDLRTAWKAELERRGIDVDGGKLLPTGKNTRL